MATIGQVIFRIMIAIIIILVAAIALIIGIGVSGQDSSSVVANDAVGEIGEDVILGCTFPAAVKDSPNILWEKVGVNGYVYKYENDAAVLSGQNAGFKGRTSLFLNQLTSGNASLRLSNLELSDAGDYKCTVTNSNGNGVGKLTLKVGGECE
ncbi:V-set domain-containing T-cell activation inhibitor 1 [Pelobates cultripes]|uniref:V-set domain-containing T-cell activation inhibitor 1 n=1 Tax=Pelobates cultripes TaxID=61616 RepID=A0AAD1QWC4_PELCU|nr:V-set domain-containing T-cell activation inhibitor 1 [Pelobates cultripes]